MQELMNKVYESCDDSAEEIKQLLLLKDDIQIESLFLFADKVRQEFMGNGILLRGIVEFSNYCGNSCFYCGLNKNNPALMRYRMSTDEIINSVSKISSMNIKTVVLQSAEDSELDALWLAGIIKQIKKNFKLAVTLSVGEKSYDEYKLWREAGADRYLLKFETTDPRVYSAAHIGRQLATRLKCLDELIYLGYQTGSGIL